MCRLLNAELYKLRKSKSFYTCTILTVVLVIAMFAVFLTADNIQNGKMENGTGGVVVSISQESPTEASASIWDTIQLMDILRQIFSGDVVALFIGTFISIFVISEFSTGMLKNVVGKGCSRSSIYLSKLLVAMFASFLIIAAGICTALICGRIFMGANAFTDHFWKNLPVYTGLQFLMLLPLASIFVLIGEFFRNLAAGISIGIAVASLPVILLNLFDMKFADSSFTPSQLWPVTRMASCPFEGFQTEYITGTILVAAFWLILTAGLGMWHFSKTDIK
ncbi:MAG: ABC transporter permease subunit [Eubacterium sp.]|nr:ABC transporter permease subunit [Eubacterium sp.]